MKILLIIVFLSGGHPIMEKSEHDDAIACYKAGIRRLDQLEIKSSVQVLLAKCVPLVAIKIKKRAS